MKVIKWIFVVFGTALVGFLGYYFIAVSGQVLDVTWNKVSVEEMEEIGGLNEYELKRIGLNTE